MEEIVNRQFQEVLATHNSVKGLRDQLAAQKPPARSFKEVAGDFQSGLQDKGRAIGSTASESWETARYKGSDALRSTEEYVRENPLPSILTAVGIGFVLGLLVRSLEGPSRREVIEVPIPKGVQKVRDYDYKAAFLPFLWPVVKFFSSNYAAAQGRATRL